MIHKCCSCPMTFRQYHINEKVLNIYDSRAGKIVGIWNDDTGENLYEVKIGKETVKYKESELVKWQRKEFRKNITRGSHDS